MTWQSGQTLAARYTLLRRLGAGRTAEAWLARDRETRADCVVKILRPDLQADAGEREHFLRAARLQRGIDHPNVLRCTDLHDGDCVLAVFDDGAAGDLARLRGAGPGRLVPVLDQVAAGLAALHARGLVHRDLKSANVVLDDADRARLTDFGLAARVGDATALPGGSPFTSSPQQLAGDAPAIADDVYSWGALAWELLTGYPPHYPDADAARAASEPPPLPKGRALVEFEPLLRCCLARHPADRPGDLAEVRERLRTVPLSTPVVAARGPGGPVPIRPPEAPLAIEPQWPLPPAPGPSAAQIRSEGFRRGLLAGSLVFLLAIGALVFFALPQWVARHSASTAAPAPVSAKQAAQAAAPKPPLPASKPPPAAARTPADTQRLQARAVTAAVAAGRAALEAGDAREARRQFELALKLDPANANAKRGLRRLETLDDVRGLLAQGAEFERQGQAVSAEQAYRKALDLDPDTTAARAGLARLQSQAAGAAFATAMAEALAALGRKDYAVARAAYERAGRLRPDAPEVHDGLEQVGRALGDREIETHLEAARQAERDERWSDALAEYRKSLALDANILAAQQGVERAEPRAQLEAELAAWLGRPERVFSSEMRGAARATLAKASAVPDPGPVLSRQIAEVRSLVESAELPVRVAIASDNLTDVTIYRVGRLGAFEHRAMDLLPGRYTAVGTRAGYRDVRREFTILPGREPPALVIRCEEPI